MQTLVQITVRDMEHSLALESRVREKAERLERVCPRMTACRVTLNAPPHHQRHGGHFNVRLDVTFPGGEIVVNRDHARDVYIALRDAFLAARRQLIGHAERGQGSDKSRRGPAAAQPPREE